MIIVKLMGGLGNQMFQYAFGRYLAEKHRAELKLDTRFLLDRTPRKGHRIFRNYDLDIFRVQENFATEQEVFHLSQRSKNPFLDKVLNKILGLKRSYLLEPHFHFSETAYNAPDNIYLAGYWQAEKYFAPVQTIIREDFTYKNEMSIPAKDLLAQIKSTNSVCVNVRRGDFVTNPFHGAFGVNYFQQADKIIRQKIADPAYFIFSDDIEWCKENLQFLAPSVFVTHRFAGEKFQDYLRLMSACNHFIIPNSSFAWWAVWLNEHRDKIVIAPEKWFNDPRYDTKDLAPSGWIRIK
jgi:Glycosyl transferase family 11